MSILVNGTDMRISQSPLVIDGSTSFNIMLALKDGTVYGPIQSSSIHRITLIKSCNNLLDESTD